MGSWYRTGTVAVTNGSPDVVGVGTLWLTQASVGDIFLGPDLVEYEITSITDDTHLALRQVNGTAAYAGSTNSAQIYAIIRNFTSTIPAQLASDLAALMTKYHVSMDELTAWLSGTGTVTVHDAVGNSYSVQTPAAMNAMLTGRLVKSVAGGVDVTLTTAEAANMFIELTGTLTANINVILPAGVRHNFILNNTSGAYTVTVKTAAGTGVAVTQGQRGLLECDGTNVVSAASQFGNVKLTGTTQVEALTASGLATLNGGAAVIGAISSTSGINVQGDEQYVSFYSSDVVGANARARIRAVGSGGGSGYGGSFTVDTRTSANAWNTWLTISDAGLTTLGGGLAVSGVQSIQGAGTQLSIFNASAGVERLLVTAAPTTGVTFNSYNTSATELGYIFKGLGTTYATIGSGGIMVAGLQVNNSSGTAAIYTTPSLTLSATAENAANCALWARKDSTTGRSINANGTVNASGADYAEYERNNGLVISKGDVVGFRADGTLTDQFADSVRFGIKSTNPSYVGGDTWGAEVGARPIEPVFSAPEYLGTTAPPDIPAQPAEPVLNLQASPAQQPGETVETFSMRTAAWQQNCAEVYSAHDAALSQYPAALAAWQSLKDAYDLALAQNQADMAAHAEAVAAAQLTFDTVTYPTYQADLAAFEARLESARQLVDRIAYSGKVPVNVTGATPGDYLIAVAAADGGITAIPVADPTFAQYKLAVGRVNRILPDGRAEVAVIVH